MVSFLKWPTLFKIKGNQLIVMHICDPNSTHALHSITMDKVATSNQAK